MGLPLIAVLSQCLSAAALQDDFSDDSSASYLDTQVLYSANTGGAPTHAIDVSDSNSLTVSGAGYSGGGGAIQSLFLHQTAGLGIGETAILDLVAVAGLDGNESIGLAISRSGTPPAATPGAPSTSGVREDLFTAGFRPASDDFLSERFVGTGDAGQQADGAPSLAAVKGFYITRISADGFVGGWVGLDDGLNPVSSYTNPGFSSADAFIGVWSDVRSADFSATLDNLRILSSFSRTVLFSDNFDAPDGPIDSAATAGRWSGTLVGETCLRSFGAGQEIVGNRLALETPGTAPGGGLRFEWKNNDPVSGPTDRYDWAAGSAAATILEARGLTISYEWMPTDANNSEWHAWSFGTGNGDSSDSSRVNNADTDYGILIRQNGGTQRFVGGSNLGGGGSATTSDGASVPVSIDLVFDSFADGSSGTAITTIDGTEVASDEFTWSGNGGGLRFEIGCNIHGHRIDNLTVSTYAAGGEFGIALGGRAFGSDDPVGTPVGVLSATLGGLPEEAEFSLVSGEGDDDNGLFRVDGDRLEVGADFSGSGYVDGQAFTVRVRGAGTGTGGGAAEEAYVLVLHRVSGPAASGDFPPGAVPPGAPTELRVDDAAGPVGTGAEPYFGWQVNDADPNEIQTAYQILVASSAAKLAEGDGDLWDSGQVDGRSQNHVAYAGSVLEGDQQVHWKVRTWDRDGRVGPFSEPASFVVGPATAADWSGAEWIRRDSAADDDYGYFRKKWLLPDKAVERATVYVSSAHKYALFLNGEPVGKGPAYHYPQFQYFNAHDVTPLVEANAINQVAIFHHWFGSGQGRPASARGVILKLVVHHVDGSRSEVGTDGTWLQSRARAWVTGQPQRNGEGVGFVEEIDARMLEPGWFETDFDDSSWSTATAIGAHPVAPWTGALVPDLTRIAETEIGPAAIADLGGGKYVIDLGKLHAGVPRIAFTGGASGATVDMRGGYALDGNGEIDPSQSQGTDMEFRAILSGGSFTFEPVEYLGMRYFQIDNSPMPVTPQNFRFVKRHSEMDPTRSSFDSPDATLNAVWELMKHSLFTCAQEAFVDTPTREKGGFLGDAAIQSSVAMPVLNERRLTRRSLHEFLQSMEQHWSGPGREGRINAVYPNGDGARDIPDFTQAFLPWAWAYYMETGDREFLAENYARFKVIADYVHDHRNGGTGLITNLSGGAGPYLHGIVDWPATMRFGYDMGTTARTVINGWAYADYQVMARIAGELGNAADRNTFWSRADALEAAMNARLLNGSGVYVDGLDSGGSPSAHVSQHANMFPLALGTVPEGSRASVVAKVKEMEMSVGMVTLPWLVRAIGEAGEGEHLLELFTNESWLGWARCLSRGATATWESWDADTTGQSRSHAWGAAGLEGYQRYVLGVKPLQPQYGEVEIKPLDFGASLDWARGSIATDRGEISVQWERDPDAFRLEVAIPVNVLATVVVPKGTMTNPKVLVDGVEVAGTVEGSHVRVPWVGSGTHTIVRVDEGTSSLDAWRVDHFGLAWAGDPDAADDSDPDLDGLENCVEYGLGFDPWVNSMHLLPRPERQGQGLSVAYPAPRPELDYVVLGTEDLGRAQGEWDVVPVSVEGSGELTLMRVTISLPDYPAYFIRLVMTGL